MTIGNRRDKEFLIGAAAVAMERQTRSTFALGGESWGNRESFGGGEVFPLQSLRMMVTADGSWGEAGQ